MTHTDGSHTIIDTEVFFNSILQKARDGNKNEILYKIYATQFSAYNEHIKLLMETSNALTQGFLGNSYFPL